MTFSTGGDESGLPVRLARHLTAAVSTPTLSAAGASPIGNSPSVVPKGHLEIVGNGSYRWFVVSTLLLMSDGRWPDRLF
jgi:hypothetical protein